MLSKRPATAGRIAYNQCDYDAESSMTRTLVTGDPPQAGPPRPKIGISSCLVGHEVRFDGGHKHNLYVTQTLGQHFDFAPFCPEVAIGLGIPRASIRLQAPDNDSNAIIAIRSGTTDEDLTQRLDAYGGKVARQLDDFSGYILKKDSPSCGLERVKVYTPGPDAPPIRRGSGIFAARLLQERPELPMEEEGRLMDPGLRENFVTRVFTLFRWRQFMADGITRSKLVEFHTRHKFLLLAHDEVAYRNLGRLVAAAGSGNIKELGADYLQALMAGLKTHATPGKNANALMHIMGFIKDRMSAEDKKEMLSLIEAHRQGLVPIIVPITLLNHFLRCYPHEYIERQYFLEPHPRELMLRNHI